jgi:hypothetical protein
VIGEAAHVPELVRLGAHGARAGPRHLERGQAVYIEVAAGRCGTVAGEGTTRDGGEPAGRQQALQQTPA